MNTFELIETIKGSRAHFRQLFRITYGLQNAEIFQYTIFTIVMQQYHFCVWNVECVEF